MKQQCLQVVKNCVGGTPSVFGASRAKCSSVSAAVAAGAAVLCRLCSDKQAPAWKQPGHSSTASWPRTVSSPGALRSRACKRGSSQLLCQTFPLRRVATRRLRDAAMQFDRYRRTYSCRFLRAILFQNHIGGVGLQPAVPSWYSALPSVSIPFWP